MVESTRRALWPTVPLYLGLILAIALQQGVHNATGLVVALKVCTTSRCFFRAVTHHSASQVIDLDTPDDDITEIQKEVALLSEMRDANRHNITLYHGCYLHGYELWIAMDFASGGSIRTLVS
jgi:serine/threonine protein kinase